MPDRRRRRWWPRTLRNQAVLALVTFVVLTLLVGLLGLATQIRLSQGNSAADQDRQMQLDAKRFLTGMLDQETGIRGYANTGSPDFLQPYRDGSAAVVAARAALDREVSDSQGRARLRALEATAVAWQHWGAERLAAVQAAGGPLIDPAGSIQGKTLFDAFRVAEHDFEDWIGGSLSRELAKSAMRSNFLIGVSLSGMGLGFTLVVLLALLMFRSLLRPLEQLFAAATDIAAGRPAVIPDSGRNDEVGQLARALATWESASRERLMLARAMTEVSVRTDLEEVLELGGERIRELLQADQVFLSLKVDGGLRIAASRPHPFVLEWAPEHSPAAKVDASGASFTGDLRDVEWDERLRTWARQYGLGPLLSLPMIAGGDMVAVATVIRSTGKPAFQAADAERAALLTPPLAAAIRVSRTFEDLRFANAELETANRHKGVFMASMSHELRTPLNAILGFSELLIDEPSGSYDRATRTRFLEQIHTSGEHLLGMINDILDLAKIDAGQMELFPAPTDFGKLVEGVVAGVRPLIDAKRIQVSVDTAEAGTVVADPGKLRQILLNLLSNAIKFTPEEGRVAISARRRAHQMEVSVQDTGIGIPAADLEAVFDEFRQLDSGVARRQQGTGLGLALTRRFVELHGGQIMVESEVGRGSTFWFWLPLEPALADDQADATDEPAIGDERPLILVVEDNGSAASLMRNQLERSGYRVALAKDGDEALVRARTLVPAAITLDILLPKIDGWEVLTRLKRDPSTRDIPVVVVSIVDEVSLGRALGAVDYLLKPVDAPALLAALARLTFTTKVEGGQIRVLVVDDDVAVREQLGRVLGSAGFTVLSAASGTDAIRMARQQRPHLVLLDLLMPDVSGFEVAATLKADPATASVPILVLTAKDLSAADKQRLNGHAAAVLGKGSVPGSELVAWLGRIVKSAQPDAASS